MHGIPSISVQFLAAALVCSAIEYRVGALLERLTGARFWDYSKFPFNINGRVCLYRTMLFGTGAMVICRCAEPALLAALSLVPWGVLATIAVARAAMLALDTALTPASGRQLSQKLELMRIEMADKINVSLKETSESLLDKVPESTLNSPVELKTQSCAISTWLSSLSDSALESMRNKVEMPAFIAEGERSLRLVARHARGVTQRTEKAAPEKLKTMLTRRELRFFNAFLEIKLKSYEDVIRATNLKERAGELFYRR